MYRGRPVYEMEVDGALVWEDKCFSIGEPGLMVMGLPDVGLVGVIAAQHLAEALGMEEVGGADIPGLASLAVKGGTPVPVVRLYAGRGFLVAAAESPFPGPAAFPLSSALVSYAKRRRGVRCIVCIVGIATPNRVELERPRVFWAAVGDYARRLGEATGGKPFSEGLLVGPYAVAVKRAAQAGLDVLILLADAYTEFPDPEAAAEVLEALSKATGVKIDVGKLREQAEAIRLKLREMAKQAKRASEALPAPHPTIYA